MNHAATTAALVSTVYIGGFFGWRLVRALLDDTVAWPYGLGLFAVVVLVQSLREIGG
jgi:hypothetical protein